MSNKIFPALLEWTSGKVKGFHGKELLSQHNGTVKLVKVDSLAEYPIHIHPDKTEYAYVISGCPEMIIEGQQYNSSPGDFFIFPANAKHAILNKSNFECVLLIGAIAVK